MKKLKQTLTKIIRFGVYSLLIVVLVVGCVVRGGAGWHKF